MKNYLNKLDRITSVCYNGYLIKITFKKEIFMSLTLLVGSPTDTHNYILKSRMTIYNTSVLRYPEHSNSIKDVVKEVFLFLSTHKERPKYITTESPYVIGYLCTLLKANHLLTAGVELNDILNTMENFVKVDVKNFKAFELNGKEYRSLLVTYGGVTLICDENYPNIMLKQISVMYNKLLDLEEANEQTN